MGGCRPSLDDGYVVPNPRYLDERFTVAFARLVTHYFSHAAWLEENELLRKASRLVGIPAVLIHGRSDIAAPPDVAWQLARAWPEARLHLIDGGHTGSPEAGWIIRESTDRSFCQRKSVRESEIRVPEMRAQVMRFG